VTIKLSGDDLSTVKSENFLNSLSGKVSGVQVKRNTNMGGSTNIVMRESKSLTGNNQVLFVVDGVPISNDNFNYVSATATGSQSSGAVGYDYGNAASDINPDDIESINVLKGAASTALYGSRASNGVVIITTKKELLIIKTEALGSLLVQELLLGSLIKVLSLLIRINMVPDMVRIMIQPMVIFYCVM